MTKLTNIRRPGFQQENNGNCWQEKEAEKLGQGPVSLQAHIKLHGQMCTCTDIPKSFSGLSVCDCSPAIFVISKDKR